MRASRQVAKHAKNNRPDGLGELGVLARGLRLRALRVSVVCLSGAEFHFTEERNERDPEECDVAARVHQGHRHDGRLGPGHLGKNFAKKFEATPDRQFIGLDAYKKAMDCLKPGDVVILTTLPAFHWVHFKYATEKGLNVFMEKPVTVDGPSTEADPATRRSSRCRRGVGLVAIGIDRSGGDSDAAVGVSPPPG